MSDYLKRIEDLVKEIKTLKNKIKKCEEEIKTENIKNYDLSLQLDRKSKECEKVKELQKETKKILQQKERRFVNAERSLLNKLKRKEVFEEKRCSKNKVENLLKLEIKNLETRNHILESLMVIFGENLQFDGHLVNKITEFAESVNDVCIKKIKDKIIERNINKQ
ncbi:hypothetical protein BDAP_000270 [Binucleata daphniae]